VDAHPLARFATERTLHEGGADIVGAFGDAATALQGVRATRPDIVLVSFDLPVEGAVALIRVLAHEVPRARIIAVITSDDDDDALAALRAGADGVLAAGAGPEALVHALVDVGPDEVLVARRYLRPLVNALHEPAGGRLAIPGLSARENEVLALVARGYSDRDIAELLVISARTVETHVSSILRKLDVRSRGEAARLVHVQPRNDPPATAQSPDDATGHMMVGQDTPD